MRSKYQSANFHFLIWKFSSVWIFCSCYSDLQFRLNMLDKGPCKDKPDSYCASKVPNSICIPEKNECFCKAGYASIKEEIKITCKSLLTSLKCRVADDCRHIQDSTCHPGPGACTCPGGTVYVPQEHACKQTVQMLEKVKFCQICERSKGICYRNSRQNRFFGPQIYNFNDSLTVYKMVSDQDFGCLCPDGRAMPWRLPWRNSLNPTDINALPYWSLCKGFFAEIGDYCNDEDIICRAKNATCELTTSESKPAGTVRVCTCKRGHVAVYQKYLGYNECSPRLKSNSLDCNQCSKSGGDCYDIDGDGNRAGCQCPPNRSLSKKLTENSYGNRGSKSELNRLESPEFCSLELIQVTCSKNHINICYTPPISPPNEKLALNLIQSKSLVFVAGQMGGGAFGFANSSECHLSPNFTRPEVSFCIKLDVTENNQLPCGFLRVAYTMQTHYEGYLEVWHDTKIWQPNRDLLFGIHCKMKPNEYTTKGHVFHKKVQDWALQSLQSRNQNLKNVEKQFVDVAFNFINSYGQQINKAQYTELVGLEAKLVDTVGDYQSMNVEECSVIPTQENKIDEIKFVHKSCPLANSNVPFRVSFAPYIMASSKVDFSQEGVISSPLRSNKNTSRWTLDLSLRHFRSDLFNMSSFLTINPKTRTKRSTKFVGNNIRLVTEEIRVKCIFRLCRNRFWCEWPMPCVNETNVISPANFLDPFDRTTSSEFEDDSRKPINNKVVVRIAKIIIARPPSSGEQTNTPRIPEGLNTCKSGFCPNSSQILMILSSVGVLSCLATLLAILMARGQRSCFLIWPWNSVERRREQEGGSYQYTDHHSGHSNFSYQKPYISASKIEQNSLNQSLLWTYSSQNHDQRLPTPFLRIPYCPRENYKDKNYIFAENGVKPVKISHSNSLQCVEKVRSEPLSKKMLICDPRVTQKFIDYSNSRTIADQNKTNSLRRSNYPKYVSYRTSDMIQHPYMSLKVPRRIQTEGTLDPDSLFVLGNKKLNSNTSESSGNDESIELIQIGSPNQIKMCRFDPLDERTLGEIFSAKNTFVPISLDEPTSIKETPAGLMDDSSSGVSPSDRPTESNTSYDTSESKSDGILLGILPSSNKSEMGPYEFTKTRSVIITSSSQF